MNILDLRTVFVTNIFTFSICTLVMALLWRQNRRRYPGMDLLFVDYAMQTVAVFLVALRGAIPNLMSMALAQFLVLAGSILGYMGLQRFVGKIGSQIHNLVLLAFFSIVFIYFSLVPTEQNWRHLVFSLAFLAVWFQCFWLMMYEVEPGMRPLTQGVGIVFGGFCGVNVARIVLYFVAPQQGPDYLKAGTFEVLVIIVYQMLLILLTFSLVLMVNKRLFGDLKTQEEKFAKAFHSSPNAIVLSRLHDGRILEVNGGFENISGYLAAEIIGKTGLEINVWASEEDRKMIVSELSREGRIASGEKQFRNKAGEEITGLLAMEIITIDGEKCILTTVSDITERKRMEEEIRELSLRDALTDLYNRRGFFAVAEQEMKTAKRTGMKLYLTFIDCDGLKEINDTFGHEEGDAALTATAEVLRHTFRTSDIIARMGGDEFAVLTAEAKDIDPEVLSRRLQANIAAYNDKHARPWQLAMSWGTSVYNPEQPVILDEIIAAADGLMYRNKKAKTASGGDR